jgi:uncharacterized membrane protein
MAQNSKTGSGNGPVDRLKSEAVGLIDALGDRAMASVRQKVEGAAGRLTDYADSGAGPGLVAAVTGAKGLAEGKSPARSLLGAGMTAAKEKVKGLFGRGGAKDGHGKKQLKLTNIAESIDVGVPVRLAYNQWTQFTEFPTFMKKVESVEQAEDGKLNWKAQVFWSHRTWEATILEQVPDDKIIWRSKGAKGHVDGAVTFHELAPRLTRILLVMEYHPQGFFEGTGNLWRAQGRRARLELKHFRRHLMREAVLHPEEIEGWRGVIHDGEVVQDHESALAEEEGENGQEALDENEQEPDREAAGDEYADEYENGGEGEPSYEDGEDGEPDYESEDEKLARGGAGNGRRGRGDGDGGARAPARSRRTAGRPQRRESSGAEEDRPRRTLRRVGARGGESS